MGEILSKINCSDSLAAFLILIAPFLVHLEYLEYSFFKIEVLIIVLAHLIVATILFARIDKQSLLLRSLLFTILITLLFDYPTTILNNSFAPFIISKLLSILSIFILLLIFLRLKEKLSKVLLVIFITFNATTLSLYLFNGPNKLDETNISVANQELPNILHLYFDAHIGLEGLPGDFPETKLLKEQLKTFYMDNGFQVYGGAYSSYFRSPYSTASMLNYFKQPDKLQGTLRENKDTTKSNEAPFSIEANAYFQRYHDKGYVINVYQTGYLNFCKGNIVTKDNCNQYLKNAIDKNVMSTLTLSQRSKLLSIDYFTNNWVIMKLFPFIMSHGNFKGLSSQGRQTVNMFRGAGAMRVTSVLDRMSDDIEQSKGGQMFFGHLLIPHSPYIWTRNCTLAEPLYSWPRTETRDSLESSDLFHISKATRDSNYRAYFNQLHCVKQKLNTMFTRLKSNGVFDNTIIIMHGDHGSRITENELISAPNHSIQAQDMIAGFSTLFAIKRPDLAPVYYPEYYALNDLFSHFMGPVAEIPPVTEGLVYLETLGDKNQSLASKKWDSRVVPLP